MRKRGLDHTDLTPYREASGADLKNSDSPPLEEDTPKEGHSKYMKDVDTITIEGATGPHDGTLSDLAKGSLHDAV